MLKVSEGAEAQIYSLAFLGQDGILKRRAEKGYRIREIDEGIRAQRTKSEARIMGLVSALGINSPIVLLVDRYDIIMSRVSGRPLSSVLGEKTVPRGVFSVLGGYAAMLHNNDVTHGDFTPANVLVGKGGAVCLIDFGLSEITNSVEQKAIDILLMKRSLNARDFSAFVNSYRKRCKGHAAILKRLGQIERRGRYKTRTIMVE